MASITEATVEQVALAWQIAHGPDLAPDERTDYGAALEGSLRNAIAPLNPGLSSEAWDDAFAKLTHPAGSNLYDWSISSTPDPYIGV